MTALMHSPGTDQDAGDAFTTLTGEPCSLVTRLDKGYGHHSWIIHTGSGRYLLKAATRRPTVADMFREISAQQLAAVSGVVAPRVVAADPTADNRLGRPFFLQTWLNGVDAEESLPADAPGRCALAGRIGHSVAIMHRLTCPRFAEDTSATRSWPDWRTALRWRLAKVRTAHEHAGLLRPATLTHVVAMLADRIDRMREGIRPALTHRDLWLPNLIDRGDGLPAGIIDFESAACYDPVWDFVKLDMWVFASHPDLRAPFMDAYTAESPLPADFDSRLLIYRGIEYLAGVVFFGRTFPNPAMADSFRQLLDDWLVESRSGRS